MSTSCQKVSDKLWLNDAEEAILMGYSKFDYCFEGYVLDIITEKSQIKELKYTRRLPVLESDYIYKMYPIKVRIVYSPVEDSCTSMKNVIQVHHIEIVD